MGSAAGWAGRGRHAPPRPRPANRAPVRGDAVKGKRQGVTWSDGWRWTTLGRVAATGVCQRSGILEKSWHVPYRIAPRRTTLATVK
jgi:hypothetical protein